MIMAQPRELLQKGWSLSPYTLVRTTGFPFELLDALNCPEIAATLDAQEDAHGVEEIFAGEFASLLAHLKSISERDDVREALFLSSPSAFASLRIPSADVPLRSKDRKLLKHFVLYLQRLTTKCDTNSFFGPTWWGTIGQCQELIDFSAPTRFSIARRHVLWTHWAVAALARAISADPHVRELLEVRPLPGLAFVRGNTAWLTDFTATPPESRGPITLGDVEADILAKCLAARMTHQELHYAELVSNDVNRRAALDSLIVQGLLRAQIEIPSGLGRPLDWLMKYMQRFPAPVKEHWLPVLAELEEGRLRYANGDLAVRQRETAHIAAVFETTSHSTAMRGQGTFYSDRALLCEEAERDWLSCNLGTPLLAHIAEELLPTVYVLLDIQSHRHRLRQEAASAWFAARFPGAVEIPLPQMLAVAENDETLRHALAQAEEAIEPFSVGLGRWLCQGEPERRHVAIEPDAMRARAAEVDLLPCVVNPDLMIGASNIHAANSGDYYLVMGEVHTMQDLIVRGSPVVTHPDKERAVAATVRQYARILPGVTVAEPVLEHTDKTKVMLPHSLLQIEFGGRALDPVSDSAGSAPGVLQAGDLMVRRNGNILSLTAPGVDALATILLTRTPVWSPFNRTSVLNIFALPHSNRLGGQIYTYPPGCMHFPRVSVGRLIIHRETWWMAPRPAWEKMTGYSLDAWHTLRHWRDERHIPERVFVRFSDEPKPVYLDFRNPLLVNWFVRKIATADQSVQIAEFLPEVTDLWMRDYAGSYCCEFRMTMYLDGGYPRWDGIDCL